MGARTRTPFKKGTTKGILAAHNAGLEYFCGTGSQVWGSDDGRQLHSVRVVRPRGQGATVQHDCKGVREVLTDSHRRLTVAPMLAKPGELEMLNLVLALTCWDCNENGPRLSIDESLADEAISGFVISPEADEADNNSLEV